MTGHQRADADELHVFGRADDVVERPDADPRRARGQLGWFRAADGSRGAAVAVDFERPHAALVVGKRGSGKSYTLGVIAEGLARAPGVAPVVVDPMGEFGSLADGVPAYVVDRPQVAASALAPRAWCSLLDLDPGSAVGGLVWRAAERADTLAAMRATVTEADAERAARRAAANHLSLAAGWGVFDPDGLAASDLRDEQATVLDLSSYGRDAAGAVLHAVAAGCYRDALDDAGGRLPWLLVDEAGAFADGVAAPALRTVLTRGRTPGVSLVLATQRPSALPPVAVSQADLICAHRLTAESDIEALSRSRPTYLRGSLRDRLPSRPGEALVVDEATERAATIRVRERETPHGGTTPRASERAGEGAPREPATDGPGGELRRSAGKSS